MKQSVVYASNVETDEKYAVVCAKKGFFIKDLSQQWSECGYDCGYESV